MELAPTRSELHLRTDANMRAKLAIVGCLVGQVGLDGGSRPAVAAAAYILLLPVLRVSASGMLLVKR